MFLRDLYRHSRLLFLLFAGFLFSFIFLNIKWGIVATPVYQYGMFSKPFYLSDTFDVFEFYIEDEQIFLNDLHFTERDLLLVSLERFKRVKEGNRQVFETISRFIPLPVSTKNIPGTDQFNEWYRNKARHAFERDTRHLNVYSVKQTGNITLTDKRKQIFPVAE